MPRGKKVVQPQTKAGSTTTANQKEGAFIYACKCGCGTWSSNRSNQQFKTRDCVNKWKRDTRVKKVFGIRNCVVCGKPFKAVSYQHHYHEACREKYYTDLNSNSYFIRVPKNLLDEVGTGIVTLRFVQGKVVHTGSDTL